MIIMLSLSILSLTGREEDRLRVKRLTPLTGEIRMRNDRRRLIELSSGMETKRRGNKWNLKGKDNDHRLKHSIEFLSSENQRPIRSAERKTDLVQRCVLIEMLIR